MGHFCLARHGQPVPFVGHRPVFDGDASNLSSLDSQLSCCFDEKYNMIPKKQDQTQHASRKIKHSMAIPALPKDDVGGLTEV